MRILTVHDWSNQDRRREERNKVMINISATKVSGLAVII
jgi:hypothetical protein